MKKIITLILTIISFNIYAQNWRTIVPSDTVYYALQVPINSLYYQSENGYLRSVNVVNSIVQPSFEKLTFPFSTRPNSVGVLDSMGDTWIGKTNYRFNIGEELFFNQIGDSIKINTLANLNDTWKIITDTNGIDFYGTINSVGVQMIDGVIDSIKNIQIQAFQNASPVNHYFNSFHITLSKNHGFYEIIEFFGFPYLDTLSMYNIPQLMPYKTKPFVHKRVDKFYGNIVYNEIDLLWKYKPGNEWIQEGTSSQFENYQFIVHDSIISSTLLTPNSIEVQYYEHSFVSFRKYQSLQDSVLHTYLITTDTIYSNSIQHRIIEYLFEESMPNWIQNYTKTYRNNFMNIGCGNRIFLKMEDQLQTILSGGNKHLRTYYSGFGLYDFEDYYDNGISTDYQNVYTTYSKLDSCIEGVKINFKSLNVNENNLEEYLKIFPNPTTNLFSIDLPNQFIIKKVEIIDIQSNKVKSVVCNFNSIDVSNLTTGIYFIKVNTNKGIINMKLIKE